LTDDQAIHQSSGITTRSRAASQHLLTHIDATTDHPL